MPGLAGVGSVRIHVGCEFQACVGMAVFGGLAIRAQVEKMKAKLESRLW